MTLSVPRFPTLGSLKAATLRSHLAYGGGAVLVEKAHLGAVADADMKELHAYVIEARRFGGITDAALRFTEGFDGAAIWARACRTMNFMAAHEALLLVAELFGCEATVMNYRVEFAPAGSNAVMPKKAWPFAVMPPGTPIRRETILSLSCRFALRECQYWTGTFNVEGTAVNAPAGSLLITHGDVAVGRTDDIGTDSGATIAFDLVPNWLIPPP